ncbi:hypothetical protein ACFCX4_14440 [Kitasatospora sp. NPDC056327]|uniref:hypothetical protein n=1 Tax=Kitasatospora sp. NPDC056327 TaxID=3345785 RepID=UPI0035D915AA
MSVSLYYTAHRATAPTRAESAAVERVVAAHTASFPYQDEESLFLYEHDEDDPEQILAGSTKLPSDPGRLLPVMTRVLDSVTSLRRALPGADWHVHLDDLDVPWDEEDGYAFPDMPDGEIDMW